MPPITTMVASNSPSCRARCGLLCPGAPLERPVTLCIYHTAPALEEHRLAGIEGAYEGGVPGFVIRRMLSSHARSFGPQMLIVRDRAPCPYSASSFTSR
jgi:hypothetical protein